MADNRLSDGDAVAVAIEEDVFARPSPVGGGGRQVIALDEVDHLGGMKVRELQGTNVDIVREAKQAAGGLVEVEDVSFRGALADEIGGAFEGGGEAFAFGLGGAKAFALLAFTKRAADGGDEAKGTIFQDVIVSAGPHGIDGAVFADVAGKENEGRGGGDLAGEAEGFGAVEAHQGEIGKDEIVRATQFFGVAFARGDRGDGAIGPLLGEKLANELGVLRAIFQVQNPHDHYACKSGASSDRLHG